MRGRVVKVIRQSLRMKGIAISAEPYKKLDNGQVVASEGRQMYQKLKESCK